MITILTILGLTALSFLGMKVEAEVNLRGIAPEVLGKYTRSDSKFRCLDGTTLFGNNEVIINDDYCDCVDGSDEPGTSACPNSKFYCNNIGHIAVSIPSSRVNDGLCDCCDGSDEYRGTECENTCVELHSELVAETERQLRAANVGWDLKQAMIQEAKAITAQRERDIEETEALIEILTTEVERLRALKVDAEEVENRLRKEFNAAKRESSAGSLDLQAEQHCSSLKDQVGVLTGKIQELKDNIVDLSSNLKEGSDYSLEPIRKLLDELKSNIPQIPAFCLLEAKAPLPRATQVDTPQEDDQDESDNLGEDYDAPDPEDDVDDYNDDGDDDDDGYDENIVKRRPVAINVNEINEGSEGGEPAELISAKEAAATAKENHKMKNAELNNAQNRLSELEATSALDFGPDQEFSILHARCYTFETNEYTYELCPFKKCNQKSKNGGSQTPLGTFTEWAAVGDNTHAKMKFGNGQRCWGGPDRSVVVSLQCGEEHKILSVEEPAKCEYAFVFATPLACSQPGSVEETIRKQHSRDEL